MDAAEYKFIQDYVKEQSGIVLAEGKEYLVESRLTPLARSNGLDGIGAIVSAMRDQSQQHIRDAVVDAMTTNESFFFRDKTPFELFDDIMLPSLTETRATQKRLRIWCAAASSGQEPYSLALSINEKASILANWNVNILGTDISTEILEKAKSGLYSQFEVQRGLPIKHLVKYFKQAGEMWQIDSQLRSMVEFRPLNLLHDFSSLGQFDIVFCRNVLIYFDEPTKRDILDRLTRQLAPDGFLVLGAAETVIGLSDVFKRYPERSGLYVMENAQSATAPSTLSVRSA